MRLATASLLSWVLLLGMGPAAQAGVFTFQGTLGSGQLSSPFGAAVDKLGNLYVSDFTSPGPIVQYDAGQNYTRSFGSLLAWTAGIAFGPGGTIYAIDGNHNRVQTFAADGTAGASFGSFSSAFGITSDSSSNVYVADTGNNRVVKFDSAGNQTAVVTPPTGDAFNHPYGVAVDTQGDLYVADTFDNRVMVFDGQGSLLRSFSTVVAGWPDNHPKELVVAPDGTIYMSLGDPGLAAFSGSGTLLGTYSGSGTGAFDRASGVALAGTTLYAADLGNNRVQIFNVPEPASLALLAATALAAAGLRAARKRGAWTAP